MGQEELKKVLYLHKKWLNKEDDGIRANLSGANLSYANLSGADLSYANLCYANLRGVKLSGAILSGVKLSGANLSGANLGDTNLRGADLGDTNLRGADLSGADLGDVFINEGTAFFTLQCPEEGAFIAWKKLRGNAVAKLLIPENAKRSSATTLKCRASEAVVLAIYDDKKQPIDNGFSKGDNSFIYRVGETVKPREPFDENRWNECANGIHFFMSRAVAEKY